MSSARLSAPVYRVNTQGAAVRATQTVKASGAVKQGAVLPFSSVQNAQSAPVAQTTDLPLGLLQSVVQPPASNAQAGLDYHDLRTALDSGNVNAAQLAYLRLQTDLYMPQQLSVMA